MTMPRKVLEADPSWTPEYRAAWERLPKCVVCNRRMRPAQQNQADWPQTISRATKEFCQTDYRGKSAGRPARKPSTTSLVKQLRADAEAHGSEDEKTPRQRLAAGWTQAEHAVAWLVCGSQTAAQADEILSTLGLFDPDRYLMAQYFNPTLARFGS